jgi:hypothetical protein
MASNRTRGKALDDDQIRRNSCKDPKQSIIKESKTINNLQTSAIFALEKARV